MDGYIGEVRMFVGNFAPRNWAFCNGAMMAISDNTALFSIIGTSYGGDGRTTFQLPDFKGAFPMGVGQRPGNQMHKLGSFGGYEAVKITADNLPPHTHPVQIKANPDPGTTADPTNAYLSNTRGLDTEYSTTPTNIVNMAAGAAEAGENTTPNTALNVLPPFQTIHFIICLDGTYPQRS